MDLNPLGGLFPRTDTPAVPPQAGASQTVLPGSSVIPPVSPAAAAAGLASGTTGGTGPQGSTSPALLAGTAALGGTAIPGEIAVLTSGTEIPGAAHGAAPAGTGKSGFPPERVSGRPSGALAGLAPRAGALPVSQSGLAVHEGSMPGSLPGTAILADVLSSSARGASLMPGSGSLQSRPQIQPDVMSAEARLLSAQARLAAATPGTLSDVYHASETSAPSLLTQKGVGAYFQLLNTLAGNELHEKSADLLTTSFRNASAALKSAFQYTASRLPPALVAKDWGLSISNGSLVFVAHEDELLPQDLAILRNALLGSKVEPAARQLASIINSIIQMKRAGADTGSLAWFQLDAEEASKLDLRSFVTSTAPGSHYHPENSASARHQPIPASLGGMDLRELVTARPRFLRPDGGVNPDALNDFELESPAPGIASLSGHCACGQVQFIVQNTFEYAYYCHCARCRARTGSAFAAIAGIPIDRLEVTAGHEHLLFEGECSDGYGARCGRCYSFVFAAVRGRNYLHVSMGTLVGTPNRIPDRHIHVGSKAPWYQITDTLPQYATTP